MTIEFNFTVSDEEAEIIFDSLRCRISDLLYQQLFCSNVETEYLKKHIQVLDDIILKMNNKYI